MQQQSRVEFLAKYGLAAIVLILVGSILTYGGILAFQSRQNQCGFEFGITCTDYTITPTGLTLSLQNNLGQDILILSLKDIQGSCDLRDAKLSSDSTQTFSLTKCQHNQTGVYETNMELLYSTPSGTHRTMAGTVSGTIQS